MSELKRAHRFLIVPAMKRAMFIVLVAAAVAIPAAAQSSSIGFTLGVNSPADHGIDVDLGNEVKEVFIATEMEPGTDFKIKAGRFTSDTLTAAGAPGDNDGRVEYLDAVVEYEFGEVFGSTGLFAGGGYYRQRFGDYEETDYGFTAGVNGHFPITRRIGVLAELAYHWVNFEDERAFLTASGGLKVRF